MKESLEIVEKRGFQLFLNPCPWDNEKAKSKRFKNYFQCFSKWGGGSCHLSNPKETPEVSMFGWFWRWSAGPHHPPPPPYRTRVRSAPKVPVLETNTTVPSVKGTFYHLQPLPDLSPYPLDVIDVIDAIVGYRCGHVFTFSRLESRPMPPMPSVMGWSSSRSWSWTDPYMNPLHILGDPVVEWSRP